MLDLRNHQDHGVHLGHQRFSDGPAPESVGSSPVVKLSAAIDKRIFALSS